MVIPIPRVFRSILPALPAGRGGSSSSPTILFSRQLFGRPFSAAALVRTPHSGKGNPFTSRRLLLMPQQQPTQTRCFTVGRVISGRDNRPESPERRKKDLELERKRSRANAKYNELLRGLLIDRHGMQFTKGRRSIQRKLPKAEKWTKKNWKMALVCHWKERHPDRDVRFLTDFRMSLTNKGQEYDYIEEHNHTTWMEEVKVALHERGIFPPNDDPLSWKYLLQDSVLTQAGIELPTDTGYRG